jgi:hypothetical protein
MPQKDSDSITPLAVRPLEAAKMLRMGKSKLYQLLKDPDQAPPNYVVGGNRYFPVDGLKAWQAKMADAKN